MACLILAFFLSLSSSPHALTYTPLRSHGFCIGHVVPEAQDGGPIALVQDGDVIAVDAVKNTIELRVSDEELARRRALWTAPPLKYTQGTLYKYTKVVTDASHGCVTDA
jgi:dihydroxy-acid dehydratase